jgi:glutamine synthetase
MADGPLSLDALRADVASGAIDTVVLAIVDVQGRLAGKRFDADYFLDEVVEHGTEGCNYLLAVDVEMNTVAGYAMSSWERGYGDLLMAPDFSTLRRVPWQPNTALLLADAQWLDAAPVIQSPRQVLRAQLDRLAERGWVAMVGTELEFILFDESYEAAWSKQYTDLTPSNQYNIDYSILGTSRVEPMLRDIRLGMKGAGLQVESAKGECNPGQHEIAFKYADALTTCDNHVIYKNGAKEIASQHGSSLTFMAKYNDREGNSCHIHLSLRTPDGEPVFAGDRPHGVSKTFEHFLAGQLASLRELSYFFAPNINSYKRYQPDTFAPTAVMWGLDNRTCALRVVGHGPSLRFENRVPGGDVNPYLAVAAMIAAGLHGIDNELPLDEPFGGNAYASDAARVPPTLREAAALLERSEVARTAFGADVVDHYANAARVEILAFDAAVTDWERVRSFERM